MSDPSYFETPDSPPPPAYEFCQQEFDQKVSHALEASQAEQQRSGEALEEEWEEWDEAAFVAAAARLTVSDSATSPGASSSRSPPETSASDAAPVPRAEQPSAHVGNGKGRQSYDASADNAPGFGASPDTVQPLRIVKKSTQAPPAQSGKKERPSWLEEAQLGGPPSPPVADDRPGVFRSDTMRSMQSSTPPPEFTPVGPSLDGPPYEGPPTAQPSGVVLTYVPGDSRPNSPLHSPVTARASLPPLSSSQFASPQPRHSMRRSLPQPPGPRSYSSSPIPQNRTVHQSLPTAPRIPPQPSPRPAANYGLKQAYGVPPRVVFDPRVAYANEKSMCFDLASQEPPPEKVDAASLYSSAVSSLYSSSISAPPPPPPPRPDPAASSTNLSPYSNFAAAQSLSSYHLPQPTAPAASSYSLHQYPRRENTTSPAPSEMSTVSRHSAHSARSHHPPARPAYPPQQQQGGYRPGTGYQATPYQSHAQTAYHTQPPYEQQRPQYQSSYQPTSY